MTGTFPPTAIVPPAATVKPLGEHIAQVGGLVPIRLSDRVPLEMVPASI